MLHKATSHFNFVCQSILDKNIDFVTDEQMERTEQRYVKW